VNLTAKHRGFGGNALGLHVGYFGERLPAGLTATVTAMTGGAGNPDLSAAIAVWADQWFQVIAMPYTDTANLTALENGLASRFGPQREIEGQAFAAANASHSALGTLGGSRNSPHASIVAAYAEPMPVYAKAAETAALAAHYASIDPARPLQTWPTGTVWRRWRRAA
jgi:phage tail sheath gpL-like